uniref:Integrase catalytic domain-containing protein n=1 Tax=Tanacetum cinerariifolium TaxID=118510 RepID=A0A699KFX8_TANCI|nr:hypothetical protein [Tanacetum cinerariifolium]
MTGNLKLLINFVWKFLGTVRFENDHVASILGFGDLQWGNILITRVYFVKGLGHNLFLVGQFCDSDLKSPIIIIRTDNDTKFKNQVLKVYFDSVGISHQMSSVRTPQQNGVVERRNRTLVEAARTMLIFSRALLFLWAEAIATVCFTQNRSNIHRLSKFKYHKEHLCPSCEQGKSKRASHPPKPVPNSRQRLHLLHMDLCGPMRIASINGKRTDNGTEFKNQVLKVYFDSVGISHQMSSVRTPQLNGVVERRNRTLVEAARTMLIFSRASLVLWAEAIATACFTQNRSIIHRHIGKLGAKGDIGFFIGYSADSCAYRVFNRRTKKIMETMNVSFDELSAMAFEQRCLVV